MTPTRAAIAAQLLPTRSRKPSPGSQLTAACLALLKVYRIPAWRCNNAGIFDPVKKRFRSFNGRKGVGDIIGLLPGSGRFLSVECKAGRDRESEDQIEFREMVNGAGGFAVCVRGVGELEAALKEKGIV